MKCKEKDKTHFSLEVKCASCLFYGFALYGKDKYRSDSCVLSICCFNNDCDSYDNNNVIQKAEHKIALEICQIFYKIHYTIEK